MIPFAFKLAGGTISTLYGAISGWNKKAHEGILGNPNDPNSLRNSSRRKVGQRFTRKRTAFVDQGRALNANRWRRGRGWAARRFGPVDEKMAAYNKEAKEREELMSGYGRDALRYAASGYKVAAGEAAPPNLTDDGVPVAPGAAGAVNYDRYFDSKGRRISKSLYNEAKRTVHASGLEDIAQNLEYPLRKAQTDQDTGNFITAFGKNALAADMTDQELSDTWAAATYPHKGRLGAMWYASPRFERDASGNKTGRVVFDNVVGTPDKTGGSSRYGKFIGEKHKTNPSYQLGGYHDMDWRVMGAHQAMVEEALDNGGTVSYTDADGVTQTRALTQDDLNNYAMTNETFEAMLTRGIITQDTSTGEYSVPGATPAAQNVIKSVLENRRYNTRSTTDAAGNSVVNQRTIYQTKLPAGVAGPVSPSTWNATVTGDDERSDIPRVVT